MKCDELKDRWFWAYPTESVDCDGITGIAHEVYGKSEVDEAIAKLQAENAQLKKETEFMHSNCKWHAGDGCARLLGEKLAIIDENVKLKQKLAEKDELIASLQDTNRVIANNAVELNKTLDKKDKEIALLKERICNGDVSRITWIDDCLAKDNEIAELKQKLVAVNELVKESKELLKESQKMHQRCADNASKQISRLKRALLLKAKADNYTSSPKPTR